jgi:hypothetical protein
MRGVSWNTARKATDRTLSRCRAALDTVWAQWKPISPRRPGVSPGTIGIIALPAVLGTAAVVLQSTDAGDCCQHARSRKFFVAVRRNRSDADRETCANGGGRLELTWADATVAALAVVVVRLMVRGIPLVP